MIIVHQEDNWLCHPADHTPYNPYDQLNARFFVSSVTAGGRVGSTLYESCILSNHRTGGWG